VTQQHPSNTPRAVRPLNLAALAHPDDEYSNPVSDLLYNDVNVASDAAHRVLVCLTAWADKVYTQDEARTGLVRESLSAAVAEVVDNLNRVQTLLDLIVPALDATDEARVALAAGDVSEASAALARRADLLKRAKDGGFEPLTDARLAALEAVLFAPVETP
jgi:hypothetical protein